MAAAHIRPCERSLPGRTQRSARQSLRPVLRNGLLALSVRLDTFLLDHGRYGWNDGHGDNLRVLGGEHPLSDQSCMVYAHQVYRSQH